jgi:hypothetical protein
MMVIDYLFWKTVRRSLENTAKAKNSINISSSKFEDFFKFTTFYTTIGGKDMPVYAEICFKSEKHTT